MSGSDSSRNSRRHHQPGDGRTRTPPRSPMRMASDADYRRNNTIGSENSISLLSTEEFSDIAQQATATAEALLQDVQSKARRPKRRQVSRGHAQLIPSVLHSGGNSSLIDLDNESVFTVGSECEGEVLNISPLQSLEEEGLHELNRLEDINESVGSREESQDNGQGEVDSNAQKDAVVTEEVDSIKSFSLETWSTFGSSSPDGNKQSKKKAGGNGGQGHCSSLQQNHRASSSSQSQFFGELPTPRGARGSVIYTRGSGLDNPLSDRSHNRNTTEEIGWITARGRLNLSPRGGSESVPATPNSPTVERVNSAQFELYSALRNAETEIADLKRQVQSKGEQLEMAQHALLNYQDDLKKLSNRLTRTHAQRRSEEEMFTELESMRSETGELAKQLNRIGIQDGCSSPNGSDLMETELETFRNQNAVLARQVQELQERLGDAQDGIVDRLERELADCNQDKNNLEDEVDLLRQEKSRLQSELLQAQEEVMCVLSETHDADEEVKVYLQRLEESQCRREMLERDLQRTESELSNLQREHARLKADARKVTTLSEENRQLKVELESLSGSQGPDSAALTEMSKELEKMREQLMEAMEDNLALRNELAELRERGEEHEQEQEQDQEECESDSEMRGVMPKEAASKVLQLQEALSLALEVNAHLKEHLEDISDRSRSEAGFNEEDEGAPLERIQQLHEALQLALEAKTLMEERVEEVSCGLRDLQGEIAALEEEVSQERGKAEVAQLRAEKRIRQLESEQEESTHRLLQVREALGLALEAKGELEGRLEESTQIIDVLRGKVADLEQQLTDREIPSKLRVARAESSGTQADSEIGVMVADMDYYDSTVSAARLRGPVEFGDEAQLRKAAIAAVTRLGEVEKLLELANEEKAELRKQWSELATMRGEFEKAMSEKLADSADGKDGLADTPRSREEDDVASLLNSARTDKSGGARSSRTVTISSLQLRNLRREIRELGKEKEAMETELEKRKTRESDFLAELQTLQQELMGALEHKETLAMKFHEFGEAREMLNSEIAALKSELDSERERVGMAENALVELQGVYEDVRRIAGQGNSRREEPPKELADCIKWYAMRVRQDLARLMGSQPRQGSLAAQLSLPDDLDRVSPRSAGDNPSQSGSSQFDSPALADVAITAQPTADHEEVQPTPSRQNSVDAASNRITVLKNHVTDLRGAERTEGSEDVESEFLNERLEMEKQHSEDLKHRSRELQEVSKQLQEQLAMQEVLARNFETRGAEGGGGSGDRSKGDVMESARSGGGFEDRQQGGFLSRSLSGGLFGATSPRSPTGRTAVPYHRGGGLNEGLNFPEGHSDMPLEQISQRSRHFPDMFGARLFPSGRRSRSPDRSPNRDRDTQRYSGW